MQLISYLLYVHQIYMNVKEICISVIRSPPVQTHVVHIPARVTRDTLGMALNAIIMQVRYGMRYG